MTNFVVMRCEKIKTWGNLAASAAHCYRTIPTPNADQTKTPRNQHSGARSPDELLARFKERLPEKRRKDAVLAVEYVITTSPAWWETATASEQREFLHRSQQWIIDKYGKKNVMGISLHLDEKTPHLSIYVAPITPDGRLSASEFIGSRKDLSADQTSLAARMGDLGLSRGAKGSRAEHKTLKKYYSEVAEAEKVTEKYEKLLARKNELIERLAVEKNQLAERLESTKRQLNDLHWQVAIERSQKDDRINELETKIREISDDFDLEM